VTVGTGCGGNANSCFGASLDSKKFVAYAGGELAFKFRVHEGTDTSEVTMAVLWCGGGASACSVEKAFLWRGFDPAIWRYGQYFFKHSGTYKVRVFLSAYDFSGGSSTGTSIFIDPLVACSSPINFYGAVPYVT